MTTIGAIVTSLVLGQPVVNMSCKDYVMQEYPQATVVQDERGRWLFSWSPDASHPGYDAADEDTAWALPAFDIIKQRAHLRGKSI